MSLPVDLRVPLPGTEGLGSQCSLCSSASAAYESLCLQAGGDGGLETFTARQMSRLVGSYSVAGSGAAVLASVLHR